MTVGMLSVFYYSTHSVRKTGRQRECGRTFTFQPMHFLLKTDISFEGIMIVGFFYFMLFILITKQIFFQTDLYCKKNLNVALVQFFLNGLQT